MTLAACGRHQIFCRLATFSEISFASRFFRSFARWIVVLVVCDANPVAIIHNRNRQRTGHRAPLLMSVTRECAAQFYRRFCCGSFETCRDFREIGGSPSGKPPVGETYALSRLK
jgi:hypothetical protein